MWPPALATSAIRPRPRSICLMLFSRAITVSLLCDWAPSTSFPIWAAAALERSASRLTSSATTAKPRPGVTGASGFDGRVEREEVGLIGDVVDELEDALDLVDPTGQGHGAIARGPEVGLCKLEAWFELRQTGPQPGSWCRPSTRCCAPAPPCLRRSRWQLSSARTLPPPALGSAGELGRGVGHLPLQARKHTAQALQHPVKGCAQDRASHCRR